MAVHRHWHVCHSIKTLTLGNLHRLIGHSVKMLTESQPPSTRMLSGWLVLAFRPSWHSIETSTSRNLCRFRACWMLVLGVVFSQLG